MKQVIHNSLKCCWRISEAKGHHCKFVVAMMCAKDYLLYVFLPDTNMMISGSQIKFGEDSSTM